MLRTIQLRHGIEKFGLGRRTERDARSLGGVPEFELCFCDAGEFRGFLKIVCVRLGRMNQRIEEGERYLAGFIIGLSQHKGQPQGQDP